jgi:hypothetical protein
MEASLSRVSLSGLKIGGDATMGGARDTNAEVASEASGGLTDRGGLYRILLPYLYRY